ncbi:hypothetical protein [Halobaculum sp. P14]|uniref:hypothetical protein n=1 Tax=Halobaculum sp. P14 TaxID=3421638 RepID=UPI003EBE9EED
MTDEETGADGGAGESGDGADSAAAGESGAEAPGGNRPPFTEDWSVNYADYDEAAVAETLRTEWSRDLLLADYESAGDDARNKETLLIQSFYVSLALFGLLLDVANGLYWNGRHRELLAVSLLGAFLFFLLGNWSARYRQGRDAAWDRRSEIEDFAARVDGHLLRSNDSKFKRLSRTDDGAYRTDGQAWYELGSIADLVVLTECGIGVLWVGVAVVALAA